MKYWNINKILPYQRCFNFINSERSVGKTYTTEKFLLKRAINKCEEFVYLVRTQDEKKNGILQEAFAKVIQHEYGAYRIECTCDEMTLITENEDGEEDKRLLGYCLALSEAVKIKKRSFPNVKYLMFDEYMLEERQSISYVTGWNEPNLLLNIYHTIDREEDRVICFILGNNTNFYNPYHMHPSFNIPMIEKGEIWYSENVLFQRAIKTDELKKEKSKCKFLLMIDKTEYGQYAKEGEYADDIVNFIMKRSQGAKHIFNIAYEGTIYGIWSDNKIGRIFIDEKYDPSCHLCYALTLDDHSENTMLTRNKTLTLLQWLSKNFKIGNVRFVDMKVKVKTEKAISLLL